MSVEKRALELIELIYDAAGKADAWIGVAKALSEEFGGAAVTMTIQIPGLLPPTATYRVGIDEQYTEIVQRRGGFPDWVSEIHDDVVTQFVRPNDLFPDRDLVEDDFYEAYMKPQGLEREPPVLHIAAPERGLLSSSIAIYRREGGTAFSDESLRLGDLLVPHLARAMELHGELGGSARAQIALEEVIDRMPTGVVLYDESKRPVVYNRMAQRISDTSDGFRLLPDGPRAADPRDHANMLKLLESAVRPHPGHEMAGGGFMSLTRPSGARSYPVMVTPLLGKPADSTALDASAVMFISDPDWRRVSATNVLETLYELTHAEAELAHLLATGRTLEEAASIRNVTMNTARSQLKQVFAKTNTNRQGELLQLVLSGVASIERE